LVRSFTLCDDWLHKLTPEKQNNDTADQQQVTDSNPDLAGKAALITGGAKRIGATTVRTLHAAGMNVVVHCRHSRTEADALALELNTARPHSAAVVQGDLDDDSRYQPLIEEAGGIWDRLDVLINNASTFYPTPVGSITLDDWHTLMNSNLKAPLFLSQAAAPRLKDAHGCIINMVDVHALRPMRNHPVYCAAKAGLVMLTQSLAKELGPAIRVNGVAPGAILWPDNEMNEDTRSSILERTALKRAGEPRHIADTILFLVNTDYITGQIICVDGGRTLNI
jgi:pteridine reductase